MNRAGVPLMEIVGEPDLRSPDEARAYLVKLQQILRYIGVSKANMEEGNFRCDANVSLRPAGATELGSKVEVKNMNSFRAVDNALQFEIERQTRELDAGERIPQETRGWVEAEGRTVSQRSKEAGARLSLLPGAGPAAGDARRRRTSSGSARCCRSCRTRSCAASSDEYGLSRYEANLLTETPRARRLLRAGGGAGGDRPERNAARLLSRAVANWMLGDFARLLHADGYGHQRRRRSRRNDLYAMIALVEEGTITGTIAKSVFEEMFRTGKEPAAVVKELGLEQISGADEIGGIVDRVIEANPKPVEDYRAGKQEAIKFLVGQAMRETRGRANPATLTEILQGEAGSEGLRIDQ